MLMTEIGDFENLFTKKQHTDTDIGAMMKETSAVVMKATKP